MFAPVFASDNLVQNSVRKITVAQDAHIHRNWIRENVGVIERENAPRGASQGTALRPERNSLADALATGVRTVLKISITSDYQHDASCNVFCGPMAKVNEEYTPTTQRKRTLQTQITPVYELCQQHKNRVIGTKRCDKHNDVRTLFMPAASDKELLFRKRYQYLLILAVDVNIFFSQKGNLFVM
ncbi:hypothetical protein WN51_00910 [Melipona quadrifasciata]|uniref:Uncharacterized protein n=1 Tax=Melipona quadrifasciata TaxID=166423 RepID=A0A0M8ZYA5_9HYME|nr:hypothetical protein WN51_00910 [Melipona quadrifasciata]